tara:strand:- start:397 stop:1035 length:639 start_codon:yes stop_codon:yes gene_type:complete
MEKITYQQTAAIEEFIDLMTANWSRLDTENWRHTFRELCKGTFANCEPDVIVKAGWHVLQEITSSFPPSMGEILHKSKEIIGSGRARTVQLKDCEKCDAGKRLIVFWLLEHETNRHVKHNGICACDCQYGKAQQKRLGLENIHVCVGKMEDHPRLIDNRIWFQTRKGERPSLEIEKYDMDNFYKFCPPLASDFRKKYQHVLQQIADAQDFNN